MIEEDKSAQSRPLAAQTSLATSGSEPSAAMRLTKAQMSWMRHIQRHGAAEISGIRDLEMADRLAEKGVARIYEKRPGFYGLALTDVGRAALARADSRQ